MVAYRFWNSMRFVMSISAAAMGCCSILVGCGPVPPANRAPEAHAGTDQSVLIGVPVTLNGTASHDPDDDPLTYAWKQTGGTNVVLAGANTAAATFVSPAVAGTLTFTLTVSDGQTSDTDSVTVTVWEVVPPSAPVLFIANVAGNNVVAYDLATPTGLQGDVVPDANLFGGQTQLLEPSACVIDAGGALLVSNFRTPSLTGYPDAVDLTPIDGDVAPTRLVEGSATRLAAPTAMAVSRLRNLLFVGDTTQDEILVYANASTSALDGNVSPVRSIASASLADPFGLHLTVRDDLYVANAATDNVIVFARASTLGGTVAADRIIDSASFDDLFGVFVDADDVLYVVDSGDAQILMFQNASTLAGTRVPDATLRVQGAGKLTAIAVDAAGTGYIVDNTVSALYSFDNIASRSGLLPPDRRLEGPGTRLTNPIRLFLHE